jgi:adhesin transport system membrane fusion protein
MKWRWILAPLAIAVMLVSVALGVVALVVPVRFTVSGDGRLEPAVHVRLTAARSALLTEIHDPGPVAAGDVLWRQSTSREEERLERLRVHVGLLEERIAHEQQLLDRAGTDADVDLAALRITSERLADRLERLRTVVPGLQAELRAAQLKQRELQRDLAAGEYDILSQLKDQQSVPLLDVVRGETAAKTGALSVVEAGVVQELALLQEQDAVAELEAELARNRLQQEQLADRLLSRTAILALRSELAGVEDEIAIVEDDLDRKTVRAPCDGEWVGVLGTEGEYVNQGQAVGLFLVPDRLRMVVSLSESRVAWVERGQKARLRLTAFPFLKYGVVHAEVRHIEPLTDPGTPGYRVELDVDLDNARMRPRAGMTGTADIYVFHGTVVEYLLCDPVQGRTEPPFIIRSLQQRLRRLVPGRG